MRFSFTILLLLASCSLIAQSTIPNTFSYHQVDSMVEKFYIERAFKKAVPYLQYAVKKAQRNTTEKGDSLQALYLGHLGFFYERSGIYKKAEAIYVKSIQLKKEVDGVQSTEYAIALNNLAILYKNMGKYEQAEPLYLQTIAIEKKLLGEQNPSYAKSLNNLAALYYQMSKYEQAEVLFLKTIEIREKTLGPEHPVFAQSLNNLAALYEAMGKYEQAEPLYLQAMEIKEAALGPKHPSYATSVNNLAALYENMKKYTKAQILFQKTIAIRKESLGESHPAYGYALNNLAQVYEHMHNYAQAEPLFKQTIAIKAKTLGKHHPAYATSLDHLAHLYRDMESFDKAEKLYLEALEIRKETLGEKHPDYAISLNHLAELYFTEHRLEKAFIYAMSSIAANSNNFNEVFPHVFRERQDSTLELHAPVLCCNAIPPEDFVKIGQLNYHNALEISESLHILLRISRAQYQAIDRDQNPEEHDAFVLEHYNISKAAMAVNAHIRNDFSGKRNKLRLLREDNIFVEYGIEAALELGDKPHIKEAFSFAEQNKSILLADAVKGHRARTLGDLPDSLVLLEIELQKERDKINKEKLEAKNPEEKAAILAEENHLTERIEQFLLQIKNKYPKYHALKYQNITAKAQDIQALIDDKTLFLEYFVSDSMTSIFVISKEAVELYPIKIEDYELSKKVKALRKALSDYTLINQFRKRSYNVFTENAFWFYEHLMRPAVEGKTFDKLIIVPDGELGHLPFETFLVEEAPTQEFNYKKLHYLIEDCAISYNYSATLWKENLSVEKQVHNNQILACAATYSKVDSTLLRYRLPHVFNMRRALLPIPAAQHEVQTLDNSLKGDFLFDTAVTEAFFKEHAADYGIIHLAMHGLLHERIPMLSNLAFTEDRDSTEDNFLHAHEISKLQLNADLIVLSACETGYGKFEQGEGVMSMARSFMYAGAPSLVVSLWQVNDESTSIIMELFYDYLADGLAKDAALRQAKLDYMQQAKGIFVHPAFWSPFIQLGDSTPVELQQKRTIWPWLIGGIVFLLLMGGIYLMRNRQQA